MYLVSEVDRFRDIQNKILRSDTCYYKEQYATLTFVYYYSSRIDSSKNNLELFYKFQKWGSGVVLLFRKLHYYSFHC